ncbi:MAG: hypothetical protein Q9M89_00785 [Persephonella sp.]|nr:hypothetical protein [Persephonella sp.]
MIKIFIILILVFVTGCSLENREKAEAVGRLSKYLYEIESGSYYKKINEKYPDLQIGLIY